MNPALEGIIAVLKNIKEDLRKKYLVREIGIFGSFVRNEQREGSDLDVLVDFTDAPSLFRFVQMEDYLTQLTGIKVDLVMKDSLKPNIGKHILSEVIFV